jgi:hypothetical protein
MTTRRWQCLWVAGLGLACVSLAGCQANVAGMTLPSARYMDHPPQYIAQSPPFPLSRELAEMEAQETGNPLPAAAVPVPPPPPPPQPVQAAPLPRPMQ